MTQAKATGGWYGDQTATLGDRIAGAREAQGLSPQELAARLGVLPKTLAGWEADGSEPRGNKMAVLAGLLGVSLMWLLTGEGEGLDGPEPGRPPEAARAILSEIGAIRDDMDAASDRLARLEKRLRPMLAAGGQAG